MIEVNRLVLAGDKTFQDCKIFNREEQTKYKVPNVFEDDQLFFIDKLGDKYFIPDYMITTAEFLHSPVPKMALDRKMAVKVTRVNVSSDITHAPAWIIPNRNYDELGVPRIFDGLMQFTFFDVRKILYVTADTNICLIQK
jgi:hypothetical protein